MHGGYYFAGAIHSDKYHLSAEGEITRGVSHQKEQKVKVIIMSSQVILLTPKSQRLKRGTKKGTVTERKRDMLTDRN